MSVDRTWLAVDEHDRVLVLWTNTRGAYPHATRLLEDYPAEELSELEQLLRLDLPLHEQPARHLSHVMDGEPDLYRPDGGRGMLTLADLPLPWRADARQYRLQFGNATEVHLRDHVQLDDFTAHSWGEAVGIHPSDRARHDAIPTLPGWPKKTVEDRIIGLYAAILFQACVCNSHGGTVTISLPGGPTPPLPVPSEPSSTLDWTPILPSSGSLQRILWAHTHPANEFTRPLTPADLVGPALFERGRFVVNGHFDSKEILMLQKGLRSVLSDQAWNQYVTFLAEILEASPSLSDVRYWVLTWRRAHPWAEKSTMDSLFGGGGRVRLK